MARTLVEKYRMGMITDNQLIVESLCAVDPHDPAPIFSGLPDSILHRMLQFVNEYLQSRMVTNYGALPSQDQVLAARRWIETSLKEEANKSA